MWPSLVKIQYTELKLSCGNDPVVKKYIYSNVTLTVDLMTPTYIGFFPFHRGIIWPSLVKIQYSELSYRAETILLSKIIFIVTVTLTFDPKINRVLLLPQGNHVAKFGKDPIYTTKVIDLCGRPPAARHTQSHNTARLETGV